MKLLLSYIFCFISFITHSQCGFIEELETMPLEIGTSRVYEYQFFYDEETYTSYDTLKIISNFDFEGTDYPVYREVGIYKYLIWVEDDIVFKGVHHPNTTPPKIIDQQSIAIVDPSIDYKLFMEDSITTTEENTSFMLNGCQFENTQVYTYFNNQFNPPELSKKVYFKPGIGVLLTEVYEQNKIIETETLVSFNENKLITNTEAVLNEEIIQVSYYDLFGRLIQTNDSFHGIAIKVSEINTGTEIIYKRVKVLL